MQITEDELSDDLWSLMSQRCHIISVLRQWPDGYWSLTFKSFLKNTLSNQWMLHCASSQESHKYIPLSLCNRHCVTEGTNESQTDLIEVSHTRNMIFPAFSQDSPSIRDNNCRVPQCSTVDLIPLQNGRHYHHVVFFCQLQIKWECLDHLLFIK